MTRPLRIVHAMRSDAFAGVEQFVMRLAVRQAQDGHTVHVIGGEPFRMGEGLRAHSVSFTPTARTIETARAIRRASRYADIVNSHMTAADVAATLALRMGRSGPALISTRHFTSPRGRFAGIPIDVGVSGRIDAEISISRAVAKATGRPSTVVHSGVEAVGASDVPRSRTVLMAQRLEAEKRADIGIRAFAASGLGASGWSLEIAGDGAERPRLERLSAQLGVGARFLGFCDDLTTRYRTAGILLAPCTVEGLGLTVIEAMAWGTPVVAADAGGHREILEGLDRRALYSAEDAEAAAHALSSLAADPPGRAALGRALRDRQRAAFSIESQARETEAVYRAAIAMRRAAT